MVADVGFAPEAAMRRLYLALVFPIVLVALIFPYGHFTYAQQPAALVIEGGTLIDGNGGAPVLDSVVVIQGNKITSVSRKGQIAIPAGARIISATGKFVLPGLWDSQAAYSWYFGEALMIHGITSTIDVGTDQETAVPHRDSVLHGKVLSPRSYTGIVRIGSQLEETGFEMPLNTIRKPHSLEETRDIVRTVLNAGADYVIFYDGALPFDWYKAGVEEAHKMGKPAFMRAYGPGIFPAQAAEIGAAQLPHSAGVPLAIAKNPSQFRQGRDDRYTAEAHEWFKDPNLLKYYPPEAMHSALAAYEDIDKGAVRERRLKGWENVKRFHKMFVDAGGRLCISGNLNDRYVPGLELFQEMRIMKEVGLTPMQIIQGSTKCGAELVQKQDSLGTVETGKTADILIVSADPLRDIENIKKTDTVIFDGKVIDRNYHANYTTTFNPPGDQPSPSVEGLPWVVALMKVSRGGGNQAQEGEGSARPA